MGEPNRAAGALTARDIQRELRIGRDLAYSIIRDIGTKVDRRWVVSSEVFQCYRDGLSPAKLAQQWADEVLLGMPECGGLRNAGNIYFASDGKNVKIGFTRRAPGFRLAGIQTSNATKVQLLGFFVGSLAQEKYLHAALECDRIRGEWFRRSNKVDALIGKLVGR